MIIGTVSVHDVGPDDSVILRHLEPSKTWCLSIGDVDFFAPTLDRLANIIRRADAEIMRELDNIVTHAHRAIVQGQ